MGNDPANPLDYATPDARFTIEHVGGRLLIRLPSAATLINGRIPLLRGVPLVVRLAVGVWVAAEMLLLLLFRSLYIGPGQMLVTGAAIAFAILVLTFVGICMSAPVVTKIGADAEALEVRTLEPAKPSGARAIQWARGEVGDVYLVGQWLRIHSRSGNGRWLSLAGLYTADRGALRDTLREEFHIR